MASDFQDLDSLYEDPQDWFAEWNDKGTTDVRGLPPAPPRPDESQAKNVVFRAQLPGGDGAPSVTFMASIVDDFDPIDADEVTACIVHSFPDGEVVAYPIRSRRVSIGRARSNEIQVRTDGQVSREHARIVFKPNGWHVEDAGSRNGTLVNGEKVGSRLMFGGESIKVGLTEFQFRFVGRDEDGVRTFAPSLS